jgi:omega-6 fatty acid desaturase (delta-12 desaturase)
VEPFETPVIGTSLFQIATSIGLFLAACTAMYWSLRVSYALTLLLALPTGAFLVRVFIVQHDCGHGSFFVSRWANDLLGTICSVFTLTPYANWRRQHAGHHVHWNNLDRRETGYDIYSACLTVKEYNALTPLRRLIYRVPRHPLIAHVLLPPLIFLILYRFPFDTPKSWNRERLTIYLTNAALAATILALGFTLGFRTLLMVQLPVTIVTSIIGVWLFAIQHRFDPSLCTRQTEWTFADAALEGSSYLKLPRVLQWFTGNIGFHNVHHLATRIPNYRLEPCYRAIPAFQDKGVLTLSTAMRSLRLTLWDEESRRFVGFRDLC